MSTLVSYTATATASATFEAPGLRLGSFWVTGAAAGGTVTVYDGGVARIILAAPANSSQPVNLTDSDQGAVFVGQPAIILQGAGSAFCYERM